VIRIPGYTEDEKVEIAKRHLIPKQLEANGLKLQEWSISDDALLDLLRYYTREAGVRNLERELANLIRKATKEILMEDKRQIRVNRRNVGRFAGVRKFRYGEAEHEDLVGVSTGLAWTEVGGELLSIEAVTVPGKGRMTITGKLGDVMQESVQAARSYVRSRSIEIGVIPPTFEKTDIHIHVPEGATPKDGPSAGVAMVTSIVSVLTKIPVKASLAMTGEITLRGRVLPIGGLKEKLLAALRGGIKTVLIPKENEKDLAEIPDNVKKGLTIVGVTTVDEVLRRALARQPQPVEWVEVEPQAVPAPAAETAEEPSARLPN
jgi:ATP-dependent Lon protease